MLYQMLFHIYSDYSQRHLRYLDSMDYYHKDIAFLQYIKLQKERFNFIFAHTLIYEKL